MARISIVEDDNDLRSELATLIERNAHTPILHTDFTTITRDVLSAAPDVVLLDLSLPHTDGTMVCREIRARSTVPIIVLTSRSSETDEVLSMSLGADDFITKPYSANVLLARLDAVLRRTAPSLSTVLEHRGLRLDPVHCEATATASGATVELTKTESRILAFLMKNTGVIVERAILAAELWESEAFVDDNTLTVNVNRVRRSLEKIGVIDYVKTHRGQGYSI